MIRSTNRLTNFQILYQLRGCNENQIENILLAGRLKYQLVKKVMIVQNVDDKLSGHVGEGVDQTIWGRLKSPNKRILRLLPLRSISDKDLSNSFK